MLERGVPTRAAPSRRQRLVGLLTRPWAVGPLLFICILSGYLLSYNVDKPTYNADTYIRFQVTCSIVENNSFLIHPYRSDGRTGFVQKNGQPTATNAQNEAYSEYTLGQTVAMIPLYVLGRAFDGISHLNCDSTHLRAPPIIYLTIKSLDLILGALLCVLFFATARLLGYARRPSLVLTLLLAFGTALWPDVLSTEEHTMESLFLLAAAYAGLRYTLQRHKNRWWLFAMGVAAGLVFVTRVAGIIAPIIFAIYLVLLHRHLAPKGAWKRPFLRDAVVYAAGVFPSLLVNAAYDMMRFGKPWQTGPYPDQSFGFPPWLGIPDLLFSTGKGMIWYTPALFLLILAALPFWRRFRLPSILFAVICGVYLFFYANVNYWHGDPSWGPRYLYPTLPYLILPLGEIFRRWRGYRLPVRGIVVVVLGLSFLIQFSAVSVSYWRHWHYIYAYHYDQVENHFWGQNLNYWWAPEQSPIVISLEGIADITRDYVDHAPLLEHAYQYRLSDPLESCTFTVFNQAAVCLTDLDELRQGYNWNTFTMWWLHTYPWWPLSTVVRIALGLVAIFVLSGGLLLLVFAMASRHARDARPRPRLAAQPEAPPAGNGYMPEAGRNGNGHAGGPGHDMPGGVAALPELMVPTSAPPSEPGGSGVAVQAPPRTAAPARAVASRRLAISGLLPLALGVLLALLIYGGIVNAAALNAPRTTPPLLRPYPMSATVRDGMWTYHVLSVTRVHTLPGAAPQPAPFHDYVLVRLRLHNDTAAQWHAKATFFDLTDAQGQEYQIGNEDVRNDLLIQVAELYHLTPFGHDIPPHGTMDGVLIYQVRDWSRGFRLIGPGLSVVRLNK